MNSHISLNPATFARTFLIDESESRPTGQRKAVEKVIRARRGPSFVAVLMKSKHKGVFVAVALDVLRIHRRRLFYARLTFSFSLLHPYDLSMILTLAHSRRAAQSDLKDSGNEDSAFLKLGLYTLRRIFLSAGLRETRRGNQRHIGYGIRQLWEIHATSQPGQAERLHELPKSDALQTRYDQRVRGLRRRESC